MSAPQSDDETQLETQADELQYEETQNVEDEEMEPLEPDVEDAQPPHAEGDREQADSQDQVAQSKKRKKKEPTELEREPGKSLLPTSRVQKIIKVDKEIPIVAKEATFLISLATEEFIKRLTEAGYIASQREKRATVQHKDLVAVTRRADEFWFLEEIMPLRSKPKGDKSNAMLDSFVGGNKKKDGDEGGDIIMNEDGTMYAAGNAEDDL